jgi:fructose transport system ATP-binding protein
VGLLTGALRMAENGSIEEVGLTTGLGR